MHDHSPYAVVTEPGWDVVNVDGDPRNGKIRYSKDDWHVRINWRPKHSYEDFLASRSRLGPAGTVTLVGESAPLWAYDLRDHTVIGPVQGSNFLEVRGHGMDRAAFVDLLEGLNQVGADDFEATLPVNVVRPIQVAATVAELLTGVETPDGFDVSTIEVPPYQERYHVAAAVTGRVGCAWIDQYAAARAADDSASEERAVAAMSGSRSWPVLRELEPQGGWSDVFWQVADDMAAGRPADELRGSIS